VSSNGLETVWLEDQLPAGATPDGEEGWFWENTGVSTVKSYTGHDRHARSGLALAPYRAYSAELGRWMSRDPLRKSELIEGPNLYRYVGNNPALFIDPSGLMCGITVHQAPVGTTNGGVDVGHSWIGFDGEGYGFYPKEEGQNLYMGPGKVYMGDDPHKNDTGGHKREVRCNRGRQGEMTGSDHDKNLDFGSGKGKRCCDAACGEIKDCLKKAAATWQTSRYCLPFQNCGTFVDDVLKKCGLE
jgi:RHS repeat-associated protein